MNKTLALMTLLLGTSCFAGVPEFCEPMSDAAVAVHQIRLADPSLGPEGIRTLLSKDDTADYLARKIDQQEWMSHLSNYRQMVHYAHLSKPSDSEAQVKARAYSTCLSYPDIW